MRILILLLLVVTVALLVARAIPGSEGLPRVARGVLYALAGVFGALFVWTVLRALVLG